VTRPWLIPVGGFLGAGKTTLILKAARILSTRGMKCAAIMNDQGGDLVDSAYVAANGVAANEVTGGCFCCRFSDLLEKADELHALAPDVIFIEPVGSCTDLSATILQPLKHEFAFRFRLAPLTVVVDPARDLSDPNIAFLHERQCAEADLVISQKANAEAWLDEVLGGKLTVGGKLLDIDYEKYAQAEAALGWLNWSATVRVSPAVSPAALVGPWFDTLQERLRSKGAQIAHLKILDQTHSSYLKVAVTSNAGEPVVDGDLTASPESAHELRLNLRALIDSEALRDLFGDVLKSLPGDRMEERWQCFSPAPPKPEHRYTEIVS
jgi:hypothetical protein